MRLGDAEGAEQALGELGSQDREHGETRIATAVLRLAQDDPHAAVAALAPVLHGAPSALPWIGLAHAFLLEAVNTVSTHMRNLYAKLGTHSRAETVARARAVGLLAPSARRASAPPPRPRPGEGEGSPGRARSEPLTAEA